MQYYYVYILGVFTEKPCSKPLKRNVVYIPIITLSQATSHDLNDVKIHHGSIQSYWTSATHAVIDTVPLLAEKLRVNVFLPQF